MSRKTKGYILCVIITLGLSLSPVALSYAQEPGPPPQPAYLIYNEMLTVYLTNLARRENGIPPMRWNRQLTEAARWFSWDSVENRPEPFCGHQDTLGRWPSERAPIFGYYGVAGAENCFCGYVSPEYAVWGWMNSEGHRANILNPDSREVGLGYYRRESDGRGYVTQDFGHDPVYPPVIIEYEAITTTSTTVHLYIYDREESSGFAALGPATEMMVSNDACFTDATWEPFASEKTWQLEPGSGWRTVYVKTKDALGRTVVVSDTIYLGESAPIDELGTHLASSSSDKVTLYGLDGGAFPYVQLSLSWFVDDTFPTFTHWWGNASQVDDPDALGGTAYRLEPGDGETFAWVWTTQFIKDTPFVAYFRLKVDDNYSSEEVVRVSAKGGGTEYGPLSLKGTDFKAAGVYQEFPLEFTFHSNPDDPFLFFNFWRSGGTNVYVDGVYIFTTPQPVQSPLTWYVPGGNYRGQGVWVRYTDGSGNFSPIEEANLNPKRISVVPSSLFFLAEAGGAPPPPATLHVRKGGCEDFTWNVESGSPWLSVHKEDDTVTVSVDTSGLDVGAYEGQITIDAGGDVLGSPATVPVTLLVAQELHGVYLPLILHYLGG